MSQFNFAFYVKDPSTTPDQLKAALEAKYPTFKAHFRSELISIGAKNKNGVYIQLDQSPVTGVQICLDNDNIVTVLPNMGNGCLGFLLGFLEFAFMDFHFASEVGDYLRSTFGETEILTCTRCDRIYPHYVKNCLKCGEELQPYDNPTNHSPLLSTLQVGSSTANTSTPHSTVIPSSAMNGNVPKQDMIKAAPSYGQQRMKNRNSAILLEVIPGLFGLYGFGWMYSGNQAAGIALLVGGLIWWVISIIAAAITSTLSCLCTIPMNLVVTAVSSFILNNYVNTHTDIFGSNE